MSYISNLVHFVWGTKERRELVHESWQDRLYAYFGGILKNKKAKLLAAGGMPEHVHVYASLPATVTLSEVANALKSNSSRWIHDNVSGQDKFAWQEGYGAFSVSKSVEPSVINYIHRQPEHHRRQLFQEEFVTLLVKHGIDYEERYLWV
jgi:REP element-mobilizing transposase RayT